MEERISQPKKRLDELSLCNLLFCAMVLLLHLCSDTIIAAPRDSVAGVSPSNTTTSFSPGTTPPVHAAAAVRSATPEALS